MHRLALVALASLSLTACVTQYIDASTTSGSSGDDSSGTSAASSGSTTSGEPSSSSTTSGSGSTTSSSSSGDTTSDSSSGDVELCGNGVVDPGEDCDNGAETKLCDDDCSPAQCGDLNINEAAGEACDDGNVDDTDACRSDCTLAVCGDGVVQTDVEECDDGNTEPDDGCDEVCVREKWTHVGVATDVPVADLHLWEPCWEDTYLAGKFVDDLPVACTGDHLLVACKPVDSDVITVAAHGPRDAVLTEVDYPAGERTSVNGVDFYWSLVEEGVIGFGPVGKADCYKQNSENLCWSTDNLQKFDYGWRCGSASNGDGFFDGKMWQRLVFQAWD